MLNCVRLFVTPWTVARQAPLSMEFSRQEILEWVLISFSEGSSRPRDQTHISCIGRQILYHCTTGEVQILTLQPYFIFLQFFPTCGLVIKIFRTFLKAEFPKLCPFYTCSVQFSHSVVPDSLWPHEPQHARPPCPSPTPRVHPYL